MTRGAELAAVREADLPDRRLRRESRLTGGLGWLEQLDMCTKVHCEGKAKAFDTAARQKEREATREGFGRETVKAHGKWHRDRAKGQRRRLMNVQECRITQKVILSCICGEKREEKGRCRVALWCVSCRGKIAGEKRARFARARTVVLARARLQGLLRRRRSGGAYTEKLLTLAAPHAQRHSVRERIALTRSAWPHFLKLLNAHLSTSGNAEHSQWLRNFEWTPGADEKGHPHIHFWFFGPYLPQAFLFDWWREALENVGYLAHELEALLLPDVRKVNDGEGAMLEVIKYLTKDILPDGSKLAPHIYAEAYKALDGTRITQGARGFLKLADARPERTCMTCGTVGCFTTRIEHLAPNLCAAPRRAANDGADGRTTVPSRSPPHFDSPQSDAFQKKLTRSITERRALRGIPDGPDPRDVFAQFFSPNDAQEMRERSRRRAL